MMKVIKMQSVKNFEKRVKVAGLSFVLKKSDKICPIHKTQMVYTDKSPQPFCVKCQHEAVEKKKKELEGHIYQALAKDDPKTAEKLSEKLADVIGKMDQKI